MARMPKKADKSPLKDEAAPLEDTSSLLNSLSKLLINFEQELHSDDLRTQVQALVPAFLIARSLGPSLIENELAGSARDRILFYLRKYPQVIINGNELMVVAGISEWARRVRELRVQFGWSIISGVTARAMADEEEDPSILAEFAKMKPDDYILTDEEQDKEAAFRWNTANEMRRKKTAVISKILEFLLKNVGKKVTGEELRYVANDKSEWARRTRELRTDFGWQVLTQATGMPDLPVGVYVLASERQAPKHDRKIPDSVRRKVLHRDAHRCTACGWQYDKWNPSDARRLEAHHIRHHAKGGKSTTENLLTLCTPCHDEVHSK